MAAQVCGEGYLSSYTCFYLTLHFLKTFAYMLSKYPSELGVSLVPLYMADTSKSGKHQKTCLGSHIRSEIMKMLS